MAPDSSLAIAQELIDRPTLETNGPNRSPWIDALNVEFGVPLGSSWCASFVGHCFRESARRQGKATTFPMTASSQMLLHKLIAAGCQHSRDPEVGKNFGAILLIRTNPDGVHGHVAMVRNRLTAPQGHLLAVETCEGNTDVNGSANGNGAFNRRRVIPLEPYVWSFLNVSGYVGGEGWYN